MALLEKRLKAKTAGRDRIIYYRIAASVAVLMIISSVFILVNRNKQATVKNEIAYNVIPLEIPESKAITSHKKAVPEVAQAPKRSESIKEKISSAIYEAEGEKGKPDVAKDAGGNKVESAITSESTADKVIEREDQVIARVPAAVISRKESAGFKIKGKVISSDDNQPVTGATIRLKNSDQGVLTDARGYFNITVPDKPGQMLVADFIGMETSEFRAEPDTEIKVTLTPSLVALNEMVVVGYGASKRANAADENAVDTESGYLPPQPSDGRKDFNNYIEKNIKNPASLPAGKRVVVVVSFTVTSTGSIENIKMLKTPGDEYSKEADRLIKDGPAWKPAERNGEKIDDVVRVRIVFK
jgi:hypothetical protein